MHPSRPHCLLASAALVACLILASPVHAETLTITSIPSGATIEIQGSLTGTTPYKTDYPGGYFHKTHTVFGARLDHSMVARIAKDGYVSQQVTLTEGPFEWVSVNGKHHGNYFLLKSQRFTVRLESISYTANTIGTIGRDGPLKPAASAQVSSEPPQPKSEIGTVTISSEPSGADIYIDGKFVGQTPSTIQLPAGAHHIQIKASDKETWQRDLEVMKDSQLTLHPALEQSP